MADPYTNAPALELNIPVVEVMDMEMLRRCSYLMSRFT